MLHGLAARLVYWTRLPQRIALAVVVVGLALVLICVVLFGSMKMAGQRGALQNNLERSVVHIRHQLKKLGLGGVFGDVDQSSSSTNAPLSNIMPSVETIFGHLRTTLSTSVAMLADAFVIVVAGIYFASTPRFYTEALVRLAPRRKRARLLEVGGEIAHGLRRWFIGQFVSMVSVGVFTTVGLVLLDVKLAVLLGIIAGLLTFIPYLGTIISVIPAVLIALLSGLFTALYVVLLYLGAHTLEGYLIMPLVQSRAVHLAPGWLILAQLLGGLAAGIFGVLIAAPVMVVLTITVQMLYMEDVLGEEVHVLGED